MKTFLVTAALALVSGFAFSQTKSVRLVLDVTSPDTLTHQAVVRHVEGMASNYCESNFEVVVYGKAINMLVKNKTTVSDGVTNALAHKNVTFAICAVAMKRNTVEAKDLIPGVTIVPDALMELAIKQGEGWSYIKEAHH